MRTDDYRLTHLENLEDELCRSFPTGGGRGAAAGINALCADRFGAFIAPFVATYEKQRKC